MCGARHGARRFLMKVTRWLIRDPYSSLTRRLQGLKVDYGPRFDTELAIGPKESTLVVESCFYKRLFDKEGHPQLTACCCCSQDKFWLDAVPHRGIRAGLASSMARGDDACRFYVAKT